MDLLKDFWQYCECYEISRNHSIWSGLGLMSAVVNKKVYIQRGDLIHYCTLYTCLVGPQGSGKSTAKDFAKDIFSLVCPRTLVGADIQSREDIVRTMASADAEQEFTNEDGAIVKIRPYVLFIDELKNFLSFNPLGMISFLTAVYDRPFFDSRTIKRNLEVIYNPSMVVLACETPEWIIDKLKTSVISGGFSRRMNFVYEQTDICRPHPTISPSAREARNRVIDHLHKIRDFSGHFTWTDSGTEFWSTWYVENRQNMPDDSIMQGYRRTKHVQLLKVCMLIDLASKRPTLQMSHELLVQGLAVLGAIEVNMPKLSIASGRNELAVPMQRILEILDLRGGMMPKKLLQKETGKDLSPMEQLSVINFLRETDQIVIKTINDNGVQREIIFLRRKYDELIISGQIK